MSKSLRLSSALPGDERINGLDALAGKLAEDPRTVICAIVWFDVAKVESYPETVPTVRIRRVEPLGSPTEVPAEVVEAMQRAEELRTGATPLPMHALDVPEPERKPADDDCDHVDVTIEGDEIEGVPVGMVRETCLRCGLIRYLAGDDVEGDDDPESAEL